MPVLLALAAASQPVRSIFDHCASTYRVSITGKSRNDRRFDCAERAGSAASDHRTTISVVKSFAAAAQTGLNYVDMLNAEAARAGGVLTLDNLNDVAATRARYRVRLCGLYGSLIGGTIDQSNAAVCRARDVDAQIDGLLTLLKEDGVISNGR